MEEEFNCTICLDIADNAVETSCCHHLYCEVCLNRLKSEECPQCRRHFKVVISHIPRRIIGRMPATCSFDNCDMSLSRADLKEHEKRCVHRSYCCPGENCEFKDLKAPFLQHLIKVHGDLVAENAYCISHDHERHDKMISTQENTAGRSARLGSSSKYYCEGSLGDFDCECCNGFCGPTDGCNCEACMKLDIKTRNLPKNLYVNRQGGVCRISNKSGLFYCGRKVIDEYNCDGYCGPSDGPNCESCQRMQSQFDTRYADVW